MSIAACLHWLVTCPSAFLFEDCVEDSPLRNDLTNERVQADASGRIAPPEGHGLGVTLNEAVVERLMVAESGAEGGAAAGKKPTYAELEAEVARLKAL